MKEKWANIGIGFGVGLLVGGVLGILFAPYSGKELRTKIEDKVTDIKVRADKALHSDKYTKIKA